MHSSSNPWANPIALMYKRQVPSSASMSGEELLKAPFHQHLLLWTSYDPAFLVFPEP